MKEERTTLEKWFTGHKSLFEAPAMKNIYSNKPLRTEINAFSNVSFYCTTVSLENVLLENHMEVRKIKIYLSVCTLKIKYLFQRE